ncbi:MAG: sigma-70 family RNA polymerase sigma factor [Exilibacterium sp.]
MEHDLTLHQRQQSIVLNQFISELPEESREIVLLYYREEQSSKQVATLLGISESLVRKRLSRIRGLMKDKLLEKYGRLILSTAPTAGFSTLILSTATSSSPAAAAAISAPLASGKSSLFGKLGALIGGSMIGVSLGIAGTYYGVERVLKKMTSEEHKRLMRQNRKHTIAWLIFSGILLTLSYELTEAAWTVIVAYSVFAVGLYWLLIPAWRLVDKSLYSEIEKPEIKRRKRKELVCRVIGTLVGLAGGFAGLIVGLLNSGRLVL